MKVLAASVYIWAVPGLCFAQSGGIQTLREFDLQRVAAGKWNPIAIDWDAKGRMWVAVTPQDVLASRSSARSDSILILDTPASRSPGLNGARPSAHATFRAGLSGVGGFVFYRDGVIGAEGSQIVLVRDANGDGVGESREVVFKGLAPLNSLRLGMDGWVYGVLGRGAEGCTNVIGQRAFGKISGGIIRFKPNGRQIETVSSFLSESGSLDLTWDNEIFFSRAEGPHASHVGMPERYFPASGLTGASSYRKIEDHPTLILSPSRDRERFIQPSPGTPFSRISGAMIYEGGAWPERYHGNYYVCDPALHVIHEDVVTRAESAYFEAIRRLNGEFVTSSTESFRPHATRFGPDGALYVLVSHQIPPHQVMHGRRSPLTGRANAQAHGSIWRMQHKQARQYKMPNLTDSSAAELVAALEHPNGWVRRTAVRLLAEQNNKAAVQPLEKVVQSSRFAHARVAALWALHHVDAVSHRTWTNAIEDIHSAVRRNAWLMFGESDWAVTRALEKTIDKQFKDADERVKVAMLQTLSKGPLTPQGREWLAKLFPDLKDVWSKSAVLGIARQTPMEFIKVAFASDKSESYRELVVPLVEQVASETKSLSKVIELTTKHGEKTVKLTTAVKEVIAKHHR